MPNKGILKQLDATSSTNIISLYKPSTGCSGYITLLRATVNIKSIGEANFPYIPDSTPPEQIEALLTQIGESIAFKEMEILLKNDAVGIWYQKATIKLFNKSPFYLIDLFPYFSDGNTIDFPGDWTLGVRMLNTLAGTDHVLFSGTSVEEPDSLSPQPVGSSPTLVGYGNSTITQSTVGTSPIILASATTNPTEKTIFNLGPGSLRIAYGASASGTNWTLEMPPNAGCFQAKDCYLYSAYSPQGATCKTTISQVKMVVI